MKGLQISSYLIVQLEGQLAPLDALRELVENALDANAKYISITITSRSMTICDNGDGSDDPNLLVTPSASVSRHKFGNTIGSKGAGAKQAMATFGRTWDIHTVPKGRNCYHHYKIHWDEYNELLPEQYNRKSKQPAYNAPLAIRYGGTKITVTDRQAGVSNIRIDSLRRELEDSYRPVLSGTGLTITIEDPEKGESRKLSNSAADLNKFSGPVLEIHDDVGGRPFSVRYGVLKSGDSVLSGCHFIFGPRVIQTTFAIGNLSLPSGCYIDVTLSEKWKTLLSTNKNRFRYKDELIDKLCDLLGNWIQRQIAETKTFRMNLLSGQAAALFNDSISFLNKELAGEHGGKKPERTDKPKPPRPEPPPPPPPHPRPSRVRGVGDFGVRKEDSKRCLELKIDPDEKLGLLLYRVSLVPGKVCVLINVGEKQRTISELFNRGQKSEAEIYRIGVLAYAHLAAENKNGTEFLPLWAALRKVGYQIDENSDRTDIVSKVSNFFIDDLANRKQRQAVA